MIPLLFILGCTPKPQSTALSSCDSESDQALYVFQSIQYARRENNVAWGFDIDGHTSSREDAEGCFHEDMVDPLGNEGIDNTMSSLLPTLDLTEAFAVEGILQDSINTGELILMLQFLGLDDSHNDECVELRLLKGTGTPMVGTNGQILDGQSFDIQPNISPSITEDVSLSDGVFTASPIEMDIPFRVLDKHLEFSMRNGSIRGIIQPDGSIEGHLGGAIPLSELIEIVSFEEVANTDFLIDLLSRAADLYPDEDGICESFSVALSFRAIPAYLYED
ncbi:MAG: hypothetical protein VX278_10280 [Myxococcota bacterium]|nr:hypothetical protein [Myxococcota bacterium]